ncbi:DMT family transporter [Aquabacterium sp.]|uniref:DMT family transporter n=1 Tax=Aquabacterium sp. TaxID=1872578 RepID=UPI002BB1A30E|nr:DMT family transporter [Aquabacterium sp.]HSW03902.1 DMT family transporter [Aquabacterium sp.]
MTQTAVASAPAATSSQVLSARQLWVLALLTLFWGINWPIMKIALGDMAPLSFRALSLLLGLPCLALGLTLLKVPFHVPRGEWRRIGLLTVSNMLVWHVLLILALPHLSSGRAAILGYTMPVFSALWGRVLFDERLTWRQTLGVAAAGVAVVLLLWHELTRLSGAPLAAGSVLVAAAVWGLGTQQLRRSRTTVPTLTISFWMTAITTGVLCALALTFESARWQMPGNAAMAAIVYNGVLVFGYCHAAWFYLARTLTPVASSTSVMLIPVLGIVSGALWLGERLHWQDGAAITLILLSIAAVLLPAKTVPPRDGSLPLP